MDDKTPGFLSVSDETAEQIHPALTVAVRAVFILPEASVENRYLICDLILSQLPPGGIMEAIEKKILPAIAEKHPGARLATEAEVNEMLVAASRGLMQDMALQGLQQYGSVRAVAAATAEGQGPVDKGFDLAGWVSPKVKKEDLN